MCLHQLAINFFSSLDVLLNISALLPSLVVSASPCNRSKPQRQYPITNPSSFQNLGHNSTVPSQVHRGKPTYEPFLPRAPLPQQYGALTSIFLQVSAYKKTGYLFQRSRVDTAPGTFFLTFFRLSGGRRQVVLFRHKLALSSKLYRTIKTLLHDELPPPFSVILHSSTLRTYPLTKVQSSAMHQCRFKKKINQKIMLGRI